MHYNLAIFDPPEADCISFAALSAANEIIYSSAISVARVPASFCGDGRWIFFISFRERQIFRECGQFVLRLIKNKILWSFGSLL